MHCLLINLFAPDLALNSLFSHFPLFDDGHSVHCEGRGDIRGLDGDKELQTLRKERKIHHASAP